jgi:hypothetical protein
MYIYIYIYIYIHNHTPGSQCHIIQERYLLSSCITGTGVCAMGVVGGWWGGEWRASQCIISVGLYGPAPCGLSCACINPHTQEGLESCSMCLEIIGVHGWAMWAMWQHIHDAESVKPCNTWPTIGNMQACMHTEQLMQTCVCVLFDLLNQSGKLHVACMWSRA